jgi:serine/threonine-protein kinase
VAFLFLFVWWLVRWSAATVLMLAVMAGAGYYVLNEALRGGSHIEIPDVTNRPITEAYYLLAAKGLESGEQKMVADERVPKYYVINQRPAAGKIVRTGRRVFLTVSAGSQALAPPNLVGKTLDKAEEEVRRSDFSLGTVARLPHDTPRDTVLAQDPMPTNLIPDGARINLLVSDGQPVRAFIMPDIQGKPVDEAMALLAPLNVKPVPNPLNLPDQPPDVVLDQVPLPGTIVQEGDRVIYGVNPSGQVNLPDAQRWTKEIAYVVPNSWFEREVRIDTIDRNGARKIMFPLEKHYVDGAPPRFSSGYTIYIPQIAYIDKVTIEIYLDGQLVQSYTFEGDGEPLIAQYQVQ